MWQKQPLAATSIPREKKGRGEEEGRRRGGGGGWGDHVGGGGEGEREGCYGTNSFFAKQVQKNNQVAQVSAFCTRTQAVRLWLRKQTIKIKYPNPCHPLRKTLLCRHVKFSARVNYVTKNSFFNFPFRNPNNSGKIRVETCLNKSIFFFCLSLGIETFPSNFHFSLDLNYFTTRICLGSKFPA